MTFIQKKIINRWLKGVLEPDAAGTAYNFYLLNKTLEDLDRNYCLLIDLALRSHADMVKIVLGKYFGNIYQAKAIADKIRSVAYTDSLPSRNSQLTFVDEIVELNHRAMQCIEESTIQLYKLRQVLLAVKKKTDSYIKCNIGEFPGGAICLSLNAFEWCLGKISFTILTILIALSVIGFLSYKTWIVPALFEYNTTSNSNIAYNIISKKLENHLNVLGFDPVEIGPSGKEFRWANGERSEVLFYTARANYYKISFIISTLIKNQAIRIIINNGEVIKDYHAGAINKFLDVNVRGEIYFFTRPGYNSIAFTFSDYNHLNTTFAPADTRHLACAFTQLMIHPSTDSQTLLTNKQHENE